MMKLLAAALLTLSLGMDVNVRSSLTFDAAGAKNRPVTKVITLLKDMLKQLEKEAEEDEEIYDKMACWCEVNDREKTKAIKDAEARITQLQVQIEEDSAVSARLATEIKNTEAEVAKNQEALDEAIAIRKKELAEFNAEEKEMLEAIQSLRAAITVLSKHHGGSDAFLQVPRTHMLSVATTLQHLIGSERLVGVLTHKERRVAAAFVQAPEDFFDAAPTFAGQSYTPASGQIFGILTQMKETFEKDLSEAQKTEEQRVKSFEELKKLKEDEIAAGQEQIEKKTGELADTDERLAHNKEDIEDTKASLTADEQFLMMLKEKCQMTDQEWEARQKVRALEMEAVSKALAILSGDDAHDTFTRTFNPAFVQTGKVTSREQASKLLSDKAAELHSPRLAAMATSVKLDAFTKVKKAIDDLIKALLDEQAAEVKKRDWCTDEFAANQLQTQKTENVKKDILAKIASLETTISVLTKEIETLKAEIAEMEKQLKAASEARDAENKEFQSTVADQRETQKLLKSALAVLADFYGKKTTALVQSKQDPAGPPPPPGFEEYKKSAASGGVMEMIEQIILDAKKMEDETIRDEQEAQKAYESFVKETNNSIAAKGSEVVTKSEEKAKAEGDLVEAKEEREAVLLELEQLSNYNAELHQSCDFTMKNFELRQTARSEEVEALRQAKAILSGADFDTAMLQSP
jgi:hypothetical protein